MNPLFGTSPQSLLHKSSWGCCCCGGASNDLHLAICDNHHPSTWEEAFNRTTVATVVQPSNANITIGTWNVNALTPHVHEVLALEADIVALQEVRIGEDSLPSIRNTFKQHGFNLFVGTLPNYKTQGHNRKSIHLDQNRSGRCLCCPMSHPRKRNQHRQHDQLVPKWTVPCCTNFCTTTMDYVLQCIRSYAKQFSFLRGAFTSAGCLCT